MALKRLQKRIIPLLLCVTLTFWAFKLLGLTDKGKADVKSGAEYIADTDQKQYDSILQHLLPSRFKFLQPKIDPKKTGRHGVNDSIAKYPWLSPRPLFELENNVVPNHVFFVWCENRTFTFNDYLSVLSAWKLLEPDKLEVHLSTDLHTDKYNQWFLELNQTIPSFTVQFIGRNRSICLNPFYYALELLSDRGGVYMNFSTVLLQPVHFFRKQNFSLGVNELGHIGFTVSRIKSKHLRRVLMRPDTMGSAGLQSLLKKSVSKPALCPSLSKSLPLRFEHIQQDKVMCATMPSDLALNPLDLQRIQNQNIAMLKDLFYVDSTSETDLAEGFGKSEENTIPPIVHYVWFGSSSLSFRMYLSFLSTVHVAKAERIFIHTDCYLSGQYWRIISTHPKVTVVYREPPLRIFGHQVLYTQHRSDIVRADVLDKYGGIYMDWDVLWLRSPAPLLNSGHGAVVNLDHMGRPWFPDVLNLGVFLAKPRSRFVRLWRRELRNYRSKDFFYNALELPFKVYERHPDTVLIEKRLQVGGACV